MTIILLFPDKCTECEVSTNLNAQQSVPIDCCIPDDDHGKVKINYWLKKQDYTCKMTSILQRKMDRMSYNWGLR